VQRLKPLAHYIYRDDDSIHRDRNLHDILYSLVAPPQALTPTKGVSFESLAPGDWSREFTHPEWGALTVEDTLSCRQ
jgi:hypothetical protein